MKAHEGHRVRHNIMCRVIGTGRDCVSNFELAGIVLNKLGIQREALQSAPFDADTPHPCC